MDVITLALAKKYTEETVKGGGALKGANCTIKTIEAVPEGNKVTFEWTLTDGSKKTDFIIIKDGVDGKDGKDGIDGEKGDKGDQGVGIESITKKSSAGLVDTYLIVFTDGTESSFDVVNGANITKTSQLENDSNFITNIVNNLLNYYTKDEVYTKANIDELLRNIGAGLSVRIVAALPTEEISGTTIYLIKTSGNNYNQFMWIDNDWANLGSTTVDLSNYYTKDKVDEILLGYVTKDELTSVLIDYVKKSELAKVATSNDYNDLDNLPEIPDVSGIKPYTNVLQDSENTAPTSKALYDAVSGINSEVEKKADSDDVPTKVTDLEDAEDYAKSSDVGNISELSTTDKSSAVAAINEINDSLVDKEDKKIIELPATTGGKWHIKDFPDGHYMVVGNNSEYLGICYFSIKRWDAESTECHYLGFGDDTYIEGEDYKGKGFSKEITPITQSVYFNDSSTICFTGDSFVGAHGDTLYKLN